MSKDTENLKIYLYFYAIMKNKTWHVIGVMSGTSLDGVDLVYVKFLFNKAYSFEILEKKAINYSQKWKKTLQDAFHYSGEKLTKLHVDYGEFLGELIREFMHEKSIKKVDFIASHGHTIFHQPKQNYTLQIGSGAQIAALTKIKTICDFRVQDVAFGGQGAPLVPIGDQLLFSNYDFCLNLGGFANVSFEKNNQRLAFDICPVNIVLNHYTRKVDLEFDDKGQLAASGEVNVELFKKLNSLAFYNAEQPKSLGYEFVLKTILPMIDQFNLNLKDILCTFVEHSALQIAKTLNTNIIHKNATVLVTGGGTFNNYLIERIGVHSNPKITIPTNEIITFKEALIFAFLGVLKDENQPNCLASVTGASKDHSSGIIFNP